MSQLSSVARENWERNMDEMNDEISNIKRHRSCLLRLYPIAPAHDNVQNVI